MPVVVQAPAAAPPLPVLGIGELLDGHATDWRIARLKENPAVLVIEFPGLAEQGAAMNRIAALLEKAGAPRDRVLTDAELAALIARSQDNSSTFYQGHDYEAAALARFFNLARAQNLALGPREERLRRELLMAGLLQDGAAAAGSEPQALITYTAVQSSESPAEVIDERRREAVLRHEASHGHFFTDAVYRAHCQRFWHEGWTAAERDRMRRFLQTQGYDPRNEDLMVNEAQAFAMNTPDERAFDARSIDFTDAELSNLRERFWQTLPATAMLRRPASTATASTSASTSARSSSATNR